MAVNEVDIYIGNRIKFRRQELGITQVNMGESIGITFQQIQKYENGLNRIGSGRLYQVAKILSVPITYFYEGFEANSQLLEGEIYTKETEKQIAKMVGVFVKLNDEKLRKTAIQLVRNLCKQFQSN